MCASTETRKLANSEQMNHRFKFTAMGSPCQLCLSSVDRGKAEAVASAMIGEIARIEAKYSRYRPDSTLSQVNRVAGRGASVELDPETAAIIDYAYACYRKSGGLFDVSAGCLRLAWDFSEARLPDSHQVELILQRVGLDKLHWEPPWLTFLASGMELDLGGIGKEYAVDRAIEICLEQGVNNGFIDLGGDIRVAGPQPDGSPWPIRVRHPRNADGFAACLSVATGAVATSGDYEKFIDVAGKRYCHILDARSGWPVQGLAAVTVVADSCLVAGSVATIAMLKGRGGIAWLEELGVPHLWIDLEGRQGSKALTETSAP